MLAVRLPVNLENRITDLADKTGRTKSYYVREAVVQYLEDMEDTYLALARLEKPAKRWSMKALEKDLGLES